MTARASLMALALLMAVSGCMMRAPPTPGSGAGASGPDSAATSSNLPREPAVAPPLPVPARLVAASSGTTGAQAGAGGTSASGASPQCLAQIESFAELHSGSRVMLGQAAFAGSDQLVLTRMPRSGADGHPLDGRAAPPQAVVLRLFTGPEGCLVGLAGSGAPSPSMTLPACACTPLR